MDQLWGSKGIKGYNKNEKEAFEAKYGKLYSKTEYLGKGFFKVTELTPAGLDDWDLADAQGKIKTGIVNKDNNKHYSMGIYPGIVSKDTETSKFISSLSRMI